MRASRSRAALRSPLARAASAARERATTEVKPCARVSWISRESRSRSSWMPRSRSAAASRRCAPRSSSIVSARLSASVMIRLMNSPSERDRPIEIVPEIMMSVRLPGANSSWAHRTSENAVTTTKVAATAEREGSIAHSWGNRAKKSSHDCVPGRSTGS